MRGGGGMNEGWRRDAVSSALSGGSSEVGVLDASPSTHFRQLTSSLSLYLFLFLFIYTHFSLFVLSVNECFQLISPNSLSDFSSFAPLFVICTHTHTHTHTHAHVLLCIITVNNNYYEYNDYYLIGFV